VQRDSAAEPQPGLGPPPAQLDDVARPLAAVGDAAVPAPVVAQVERALRAGGLDRRRMQPAPRRARLHVAAGGGVISTRLVLFCMDNRQ
jgi:hypothetical protein